MASRFRLGDEEDLQWKPLAPEERIARCFGSAGPYRGSEPVNDNNWGVEYADQGHYDKAIFTFTKAIQNSSTYGRPYHNRGTVYARQGQQVSPSLTSARR